MAVSHVFSNAVAGWTGTVTIHDSRGSTATIAATDLVRPADWDSAHNEFGTLSGNTANASTVSGTNIVPQGVGDIILVGSTNTVGISLKPGTATLWYPNREVSLDNQVFQNGSAYIEPHPTPPAAGLRGEVQCDRVCVPLWFSNTANGSATISYWFGLYTRTGSTLSLAHSTAVAIGITYSGANSSLLLGHRLLTCPWTTTIPAGMYYALNALRSATAGNNASLSVIHPGAKYFFFPSGMMGSATNRSIQFPMGYGLYSANFGAGAIIPDSIRFNQIDGSTGVAYRGPTWFMINGTV